MICWGCFGQYLFLLVVAMEKLSAFQERMLSRRRDFSISMDNPLHQRCTESCYVLYPFPKSRHKNPTSLGNLVDKCRVHLVQSFIVGFEYLFANPWSKLFQSSGCDRRTWWPLAEDGTRPQDKPVSNKTRNKVGWFPNSGGFLRVSFMLEY